MGCHGCIELRNEVRQLKNLLQNSVDLMLKRFDDQSKDIKLLMRAVPQLSADFAAVVATQKSREGQPHGENNVWTPTVIGPDCTTSQLTHEADISKLLVHAAETEDEKQHWTVVDPADLLSAQQSFKQEDEVTPECNDFAGDDALVDSSASHFDPSIVASTSMLQPMNRTKIRARRNPAEVQGIFKGARAQCPYCHVTKSADTLSRHISTIHGTAPFKQCPYCDYKSKHTANLKRHVLAIHKAEHSMAEYANFVA